MKEIKPIDSSQQEQITTSKLPKKRRFYNTIDESSTNNNINVNINSNINMQITQISNNDNLDEYIEVDDNINSSNN
jgi:hypothetical protein